MIRRRMRALARLIQTDEYGWTPGSYRCGNDGLPCHRRGRLAEYVNQWDATIAELGGHDAYRSE